MKILLIIGVEGFLAAIFFGWSFSTGESFSLSPTIYDIAGAIIFTALLLGINAALFGPWGRKQASLKEIQEFAFKYVIPFARTLTWTEIVVVSVAAGIGEELFFRGVLQTELGIVFSSVLFSLLHFGKAALRFPKVALLYFLLSSLFGIAFALSRSLPLVIITHATYDFALLVYVRLIYVQKEPLQS